jgi:NAD(P)-dependent dehydrogenase (short-subunit alcohol dehydrogenase family)
MELGLRGKRAVVTGASRGIGRAIAEVLAEEGCDLVVAARDGKMLSDLAQSLTDKHGVEVRPFAGDLGVSAEQTALVEMAGDIDILVNNAGGIPSGGITKIDEETWRKGWELKVFGYINITRAVYPKMVARGRGVIVNVIGEAGESPFADYIAGCSGNAALIAMNKALGLASFKRGVRVVAVNPAATLTDRIETIWRRRAAAEFGDAELWRKYGESHPFGRPAEAREVADVVAFAASDRASYLSGMGITMGTTPAYKASDET